MNTLTFQTVENDLHFLWIVWQSSLYNSSFTSAFTHICLRSVISLNKFWSCTSTEIDMSATVIEAVCIGLLIISECIICVIQYCTLLSERFINTFCFCLNKASVFSFCLLSKYSMKKLYCNSIKDHLICCSVSFLTVIKYFRFLWSVQIWKLDTLLNSASLYHKSHNCTLQMRFSLNSRHRVFTHCSLTVTEFHLCINLRNLFSSLSYMCGQMKLELTLKWTWLLWVCNETDAQLIISKYKKNTMKRKEEKKSFIQKQEDNVL